MRFRLNRSGVDALTRSPQVFGHLSAQGTAVAAAVSGLAPKRSGRFARSIRVTAPRPTAQGAEVTVYSDDFAAHIVEFGSINNPPYSPFRRAAASLGLTLRGGGERR